MLRVVEEEPEAELRDSLSHLNERLVELNIFAEEVADQIRYTQLEQRDVAKRLQALRARREKDKALDAGLGGLDRGGWKV